MKGVFPRRPLALIVDYGMGNAQSVLNALESLGIPALLGGAAADFARATHIILPGVGAFGDCMKELETRGILPLLEQSVQQERKPYLGICLGMQILGDYGDEGGGSPGLCWIRGVTRRFKADEKKWRVPHVGWNDVAVNQGNGLFKGIRRPIFYFVHSFHFVPEAKEVIIGTTEYGETFVSAVNQGNISGVQFHPEKSQHAGSELLSNFMTL